MNINDFRESVLAALGFISSNYVAGAVREKGKQITEKKPEKKEELITRKGIINGINSICFAICMTALTYAGLTLFTEDNLPKRTVSSGTALMFAMSMSTIAPKKIIDEQKNNS